MLNIKVKNLINVNGNATPNQFVIHTGDRVLFQSYTSLIADYDRADNRLILGRDWDYSVTTLKHLYTWMMEYCGNYWNELSGKGSRKSQIQSLIDGGIIDYDKDMR